MLRLIIIVACFAVFADSQAPPESPRVKAVSPYRGVGPPKPATIKIVSPASGVVVHPGQTVEIEIAVTGPYSLVGISESLGVLIGPHTSLNLAPYIFRVQIPVRINPQPYTITAELYDLGGRINSTVATDRITLDVEPSAPPRKLSFNPGIPLILPVEGAIDLYGKGTFDGLDELSIDRSTLTTYSAEPSGIVSVAFGQVRALAPGTAKVTVRHQGLQSSVTITVTADALRITAPTEGTIVHPGQEIFVTVSASGGPFRGVAAFLSLDVFVDSVVQPYWFFLTVPASAKIGPTDINAMGNTEATHVFSSPVTIDVEREDAPQSLSTDVNARDWASTWVGGHGHFRVYGKYPDDPRVDLTKSTFTTYETSSEGILSIEKDGWFKGLAAGSATVVIRHRNLSAAVKVVVLE